MKMNWNPHPYIKGHSFLSPSSYHWVNYDVSKLEEVYSRYRASKLGTELHAFASEAIRLGVKLPRTKKTINLYVNDAIGYKMTPEVTLYYSDNAYGTADTISFRDHVLRIHDLKTGVVTASVTQLEVYAALFCLEYQVHPNDVGCELRIYQSNAVLIHEPDPETIMYIMEKIRDFDKRIEELQGA